MFRGSVVQGDCGYGKLTPALTEATLSHGFPVAWSRWLPPRSWLTACRRQDSVSEQLFQIQYQR